MGIAKKIKTKTIMKYGNGKENRNKIGGQTKQNTIYEMGAKTKTKAKTKERDTQNKSKTTQV